jgi:hypothetical protein
MLRSLRKVSFEHALPLGEIDRLDEIAVASGIKRRRLRGRHRVTGNENERNLHHLKGGGFPVTD